MTSRALGALVLCGLLAACERGPAEHQGVLAWGTLPSLPDPIGFAGPFAGVSNGALIVAGGANFPGGRPWDGHSKVWHDRVFVLESPEGEWRLAERRLPRPIGYGVSLTWQDKVVCIGGGDADEHFRDVFTLEWRDGRIVIETLAPLKTPAAFQCGALAGDVAYVAGGISSPGATEALADCWSLDLGSGGEWEAMSPFPGAARMLAVAGAQDGALFVVGGVSLRADAAGKPERILPYLSDGWRIVPTDAEPAWTRIADLPQPLAAAPTPAVAAGSSHLLVFGGDTGALVGQDLRDEHPGFPRAIHSYHTITDTWRRLGEVAEPARVTTPTVVWGDRIVLPTGEVRPGVRTDSIATARAGQTSSEFGTADYAVLVVYLLSLVWMGFFFARREKGTDDFFLAGRRVPAWAAGLSIFGTQLSAITFMAVPAKTFATDWLYFPMSCGIVLMGPIVVYSYLPFFRRLDVTTAYEYLEQRFSLALRLLGSLSFVVFQLGRMGVVVFLPALALAAVTGLTVEACIIVMGVLCTLYTVLGGIEAVIWTDVIQVFVLLGGALFAMFVMLSSIDGGIGGALALAGEADKLRLVDPGWDLAGPTLTVILLGAVFNNLVPYTTDQAVVQRYLTTADEKRAARAVWTGTWIALPASLLFFSIGTALFAFYKSHPQRLDAFGSTDQIFAWFIVHELPTGLAGLVIAGVFAAAMSSLDSSMNSIATAITTDFYRRFRPSASDKTCLELARWITVVLGVLGTGGALLMAQFEVKSLWDAFLGILGLLGGTLAGLFALGIFSRRVSAGAALLGALLSFATLSWVKFATDVNALAYAGIGVLSCVVFGWLCSLALPERRSLDGLTVYSLPPSGRLVP